MSYSKINQWDQLVKDFEGIEEDEELLIELGERKYVVRVAGIEEFNDNEPNSLLDNGQ